MLGFGHIGHVEIWLKSLEFYHDLVSGLKTDLGLGQKTKFVALSSNYNFC